MCWSVYKFNSNNGNKVDNMPNDTPGIVKALQKSY